MIHLIDVVLTPPEQGAHQCFLIVCGLLFVVVLQNCVVFGFGLSFGVLIVVVVVGGGVGVFDVF